MSSSTPRKKIPKRLAVIHADNCTGCEACIAVCPVDCIEVHESGDRVKGTQAWCEVDLDRCIGCELCVQVPRRRGVPLRLLVCPWEAIEMVPTEEVTAAVARIGGPPHHAKAQQSARLAVAEKVERAFRQR